MRREEKERAEAIDTLRGWGLKPGDTVYCILRHVSKSGMSRIIDLVYYVNGDVHDLRHIGYVSAQALGMKYDRQREGLKVGGCGMDMGFHVVYNLGRVLWPQGYGCVGIGCPSNEHSNGDRDYRPHDDGTPRDSSEVGTDIPGKRAHTHRHSDGGYALKHRWL